MVEPKLEVPAELRDLVEKTIDQAEKAFGMFFDAANKSMTSIPTPGTRDFQTGAHLHRTEHEGGVRTCAKAGSCHRSSASHANSIGIFEESVYQCRRTYADRSPARSYLPQRMRRKPILVRDARRVRAACERFNSPAIYVALLILFGVIQARFSKKGADMAKKKKSVRRAWTPSDVRELKSLAKKKVGVAKISKALKRTVGATAVKAHQLGVSLDTRG